MITGRLRKIFGLNTKNKESESNLSKETLDKLIYIFKKLKNIYKLDNKKEYNCNGYVCSISEMMFEFVFNIKLYNVDITIYQNRRVIYLFVDSKRYTIFENNLFVDNGIIDKDVFVSFIETICVVIAHFYKDYSYILESEYNYNFFEESAIKSREEARKDIVKFINNI